MDHEDSGRCSCLQSNSSAVTDWAESRHVFRSDDIANAIDIHVGPGAAVPKRHASWNCKGTAFAIDLSLVRSD